MKFKDRRQTSSYDESYKLQLRYNILIFTNIYIFFKKINKKKLISIYIAVRDKMHQFLSVHINMLVLYSLPSF